MRNHGKHFCDASREHPREWLTGTSAQGSEYRVGCRGLLIAVTIGLIVFGGVAAALGGVSPVRGAFRVLMGGWLAMGLTAAVCIQRSNPGKNTVSCLQLGLRARLYRSVDTSWVNLSDIGRKIMSKRPGFLIFLVAAHP